MSQRQRFRVEAIRTCIEILIESGFEEEIKELDSVRQFYDIGIDLKSILEQSKSKSIPMALASYHPTINDHQMITIDIIKSLPKTDLHCRFDGKLNMNPNN